MEQPVTLDTMNKAERREEAMNCIRGYRSFLADPKRLARMSDPNMVVEEVISACKRLNRDYGPFTRKELDCRRAA